MCIRDSGCTGKGNDQVRFELAIKAFAPNMGIIAPWRTWEMKSRDDEIDYAEKKGIPLNVSRETSYSKDKNLWHQMCIRDRPTTKDWSYLPSADFWRRV